MAYRYDGNIRNVNSGNQVAAVIEFGSLTKSFVDSFGDDNIDYYYDFASNTNVLSNSSQVFTHGAVVLNTMEKNASDLSYAYLAASSGRGGAEDLLEALNWVHDNHESRNISTLNFSISINGAGASITSKIHSVLNDIIDAGVVVFNAAGNDGITGTDRNILDVEGSITVGGTTGIRR